MTGSRFNIGSVIWNATTGVEVGTIVNSTQLDLKANKTQEAWIEPTLLNGWVNFGSIYEISGFYKDEFNVVHLRGLVKDGTTTNGTTIFTLPVGYRPLKVLIFIIVTNNTLASIAVNPNGTVVVNSAVSSTWLSLDGISFRVGA
jgi:hypothetical protein